MNQSEFPFIYICSLMRTGSTVLSETFTQLPDSFIFLEPHFGKNYYRVRPNNIEQLRPYGVELDTFSKFRLPFAFGLRRLRRLGYRQDYLMRAFKKKIVEPLNNQGIQVGVKEINNMGWQNYLRHFPNLKVIITGRDPRDIYISTFYKHQNNNMFQNFKEITPVPIAEHLNKLFKYQLEMFEVTENLLIKYEELCSDDQLLDNVKMFVQSPLINEPISVGHVNETLSHRQDEVQLHGRSITKKQINRWRHETNAQLVSEAEELFDMMPAYTDFWDYKK